LAPSLRLGISGGRIRVTPDVKFGVEWTEPPDLLVAAAAVAVGCEDVAGVDSLLCIASVELELELGGDAIPSLRWPTLFVACCKS